MNNGQGYWLPGAADMDHFEKLNLEINPKSKTFQVDTINSIKGSTIKVSFRNTFANFKHVTASIHYLKYASSEILSLKRPQLKDWNQDLMEKRGLLKSEELNRKPKKKRVGD
ncbi:MAG: hypothetical protein JKY52_03085 [Flavobacteriales bacterium]|nr:hypothetical protein [Flavobacteriales bacterium]